MNLPPSSPPQVLTKSKLNSNSNNEKSKLPIQIPPLTSPMTSNSNRLTSRGVKNKFEIKSARKSNPVSTQAVQDEYELKQLMTINNLEIVHLHDMSFSSSTGDEKNVKYDEINDSATLVKLIKLKRSDSAASSNSESESRDITWNHGNIKTMEKNLSSFSLHSQLEGLDDIQELVEAKEGDP